MKGYKATRNMKCHTLTYEVGKTYNINNLEICKHGFHFCQKMGDVLNYYKYDNDDFVLLEVEALGKTITDGDKTVTDSLKIIRVIPKEDYTFEIPTPEVDPNIYEYDDRGNTISETYPSGNKYSYEYDVRGNKISETDSDGNKYSYEYDDRNNKVSETYPNGDKYSWEYDDRGNKISKTYNDKEIYRITIN